MRIIAHIIRKFSRKPKEHLYHQLSIAQRLELQDRLEDYGYTVCEFDYGYMLGVGNAAGGVRTALRIKGVGPVDKPLDLEGVACYARYLLGPGPEMQVGGLPHKLTVEGKIFHD